MTVRILQGDCRDVLKTLPDASVNCCVTSPPYFGLRDYGTAQWEGGDDSCGHLNGPLASTKSTLAGYTSPDVKLAVGGMPYKATCGKCGAVRTDRQMGLEPTPDEFVAGMVEVFREVRRVLHQEGTLWLNIGDSYASAQAGIDGRRYGARQGEFLTSQSASHGKTHTARNRNGTPVPIGCKPKDLIGIPWMLAFALRADGWYLRQDIIWSKPNPMPESVRDRCTKAHEYLFLLSKSQRYYFDAGAIREPWTCDRDDMRSKGIRTGLAYLGASNGPPSNSVKAGKVKVPGGWDRGAGAHGTIHREGRTSAEYQDAELQDGRNKRSVWTVATQPFSEAHFATFPPALIKPCILAGCPAGGTVLDPFFGAGTTGLVADRLQLNCIGIELNPEYAAMARQRIDNDRGGLLDAMEAA